MTKLDAGDNKEDVIIENTPAPDKPDVAVVVEDKAVAASDPLSDMRTRMEEAEKSRKEETDKRIAAERERDAARARATDTRSELEASENSKVAIQAQAIDNKLAAAKSEVEKAELAYEDAIDRGLPAKDQVKFQRQLATAVYQLEGVEGAKRQFDQWKANQAAALRKTTVNNENVSDKGQQWIDAHPEFNTNPRFKRIATAAHYEAAGSSIKPDSKEYFEHIESVLREEGMLKDGSSAPVATPAPIPAPVRDRSATSAAAPVTHGGDDTRSSGGTPKKTFRLDPQMQDMAHRTYGPGTSHNLSKKEAEVRYAKRQLEIQEKRKNGERI